MMQEAFCAVLVEVAGGRRGICPSNYYLRETQASVAKAMQRAPHNRLLLRFVNVGFMLRVNRS